MAEQQRHNMHCRFTQAGSYPRQLLKEIVSRQLQYEVNLSSQSLKSYICDSSLSKTVFV